MPQPLILEKCTAVKKRIPVLYFVFFVYFDKKIIWAMGRIAGTVLVFLLLNTGIDIGYAEKSDAGMLHPPDTTRQESDSSKNAVQVNYGSKGWEFSTADGKYLLQFQSRLQFRYAVPRDSDPLTFDDFNKDRQHVFKINRARLKIGGNVFEKRSCRINRAGGGHQPQPLYPFFPGRRRAVGRI